MKCSFSRLLYPKTMEEARNGSYMIALFNVREKLLDSSGNRINQVKVVGYYLPTVMGLKVEMVGRWKKDPKYGTQFEMESYEEIIAPGKAGIVAYLTSGLIKGVGPKLAGRIYETFGDDTLRILDTQPDRIQEVPGISIKKGEQICESYLESRGARKVIALLAPLDISASRAVLIQKQLGHNAEALLRHKPYEIYEKGLIDFPTADALAKINGIPETAPERISAGLLYTLERAEHNGHLCLHKEEFIRSTVRLLNTPALTRMVVANHAFDMLKEQRLVLYRDFVYRPITAQAEKETADRIKVMLAQDHFPYMGDLDDLIRQQEKELGIALAEEQKRAIKTALTSPLSIISGGPGTGKTMIQKIVLNIYRKLFPDADVVCCAPTGRAARRMEQSTGFPASTVHKALELTAGEILKLEMPEFLDAQLVLVDEVSMEDMILTWHLFHAIPPGCRLILVGDADQLPSVGPGAVLSELIACGRIPTVILDKVFRQDEGSRIAENAQLIRHAQTGLDISDGNGDFQFWNSPDFRRSAEWLERLYVQEVNRYGIDNVALLTPFRKKTDTSVTALNIRLQARINPPSPDKEEIVTGQRVFRLGDKVMQRRNRAEVSNGDIGYIRNITHGSDDFCVEVDFGDDRVVAYEDMESLRDLDLAYATTIHKSQGAEYDSVLINVQDGHGRMLNRPLVYTAITRAKRRVAIVGDWSAVVKAISTADTEQRNTQLACRINEAA